MYKKIISLCILASLLVLWACNKNTENISQTPQVSSPSSSSTGTPVITDEISEKESEIVVAPELSAQEQEKLKNKQAIEEFQMELDDLLTEVENTK